MRILDVGDWDGCIWHPIVNHRIYWHRDTVFCQHLHNKVKIRFYKAPGVTPSFRSYKLKVSFVFLIDSILLSIDGSRGAPPASDPLFNGTQLSRSRTCFGWKCPHRILDPPLFVGYMTVRCVYCLWTCLDSGIPCPKNNKYGIYQTSVGSFNWISETHNTWSSCPLLFLAPFYYTYQKMYPCVTQEIVFKIL